MAHEAADVNNPQAGVGTTIPAWVTPLPSAGTLNKQNGVGTSVKTIIADDAIIPIIYGEAQVGGKIFAVDYDGSTDVWTVGVAWCLGEIDSIQSTFMNDDAPIAGVTQVDYLGTTGQAADSVLAAAITSYTDTLVLSTPGGSIGVAYSVFQYTGTEYRAFPRFIAQIRGMKTDGGAYSATPALALKDFIENDIYGAGETTLPAGFATLETDNDTVVTTEARRVIGLVMDKALPTREWIQILAGYCSCWAFREGDDWKVVSDRPRTADVTLSTADWIRDSFATPIGTAAKVPTVVKVQYTHRHTTLWREREAVAELAGVSAGSVPTRTSTIKLPGVTRYSQAKREAEERLAKLNRFRSITYVGVDEQIDRQLGDVLDITHLMGHTNREFRVHAPPILQSPGRVKVQAVEYSSADYDDSEDAAPSFGETSTGYLGAGITQFAGAGARLLTYDDADTGASPAAGQSRYAILTNSASESSGTVSHAGFEAAEGIILNDSDIDGVDQGIFYDAIGDGATIIFWISDQRWYEYRVIVVDATPPAGTHQWIVEFVRSDVTDGTSNISTSAGTTVLFRMFPTAVVIPTTANVMPIGYSTFEQIPTGNNNYTNASLNVLTRNIEAENPETGSNALKMVANNPVGSGAGFYLSNSSTGEFYNVSIIPKRRWLITASVRTDDVNSTYQCQFITNDGTFLPSPSSAFAKGVDAVDTYTRLGWIIDLRTGGVSLLNTGRVRFFSDDLVADTITYFDNVSMQDVTDYPAITDSHYPIAFIDPAHGAVAGTDFFNEALEVLDDIDVRNDGEISATLGMLNANPTFEDTRRLRSGPGANLLRLVAADWYMTGASTNAYGYADNLKRQTIELTALSGVKICSGARPVEPFMQYEMLAIVKVATGIAQGRLSAAEYDTQDLPTGKRAIGETTTSPEDQIQTQTRDITVRSASNVNTTFKVISGIYTPSPTARWFSMVVWLNDELTGEHMQVEWAGYREVSISPTEAISQQPLGGVAIVNPNMQLSMPSDHSRPAAWWSNNANGHAYLSGTTDVLEVSSNTVASSSAMRVDAPGIKGIRIIVRVKGSQTMTASLDIRAEEYDNELDIAGGEYSIAAGTGDPDAHTVTRSRLRTLLSNQNITTSYQIFQADYYPTSAAKWASISFYDSNITGQLHIDNVSIEELLPVTVRLEGSGLYTTDAAGDWSPQDGLGVIDLDIKAIFERGDTVIATQIIHSVLTAGGGSEGDIFLSIGASTGDATSETINGQNSPTPDADVTHDDSGVTIKVQFQALVPGGGTITK